MNTSAKLDKITKVKTQVVAGVNYDITFKLDNSEDNSLLERSYPLATLVVATYKIKKNFGVLAGAGGEFAHQGNFGMIRLGIEAPFHIPNNFEIFVNATYDMKINAYDTWN